MKTKGVIYCGLFTALIAVGAFIKIPIPVVPFYPAVPVYDAGRSAAWFKTGNGVCTFVHAAWAGWSSNFFGGRRTVVCV